MSWYLSVMKKYAVFSGRARRKEYWMFVLFNMIFAFAALIIDNIVGTSFDNLNYGLFYSLYALAIIVPSIAVAVRRLHDIGKSGLWFLIAFIPLIGGIWMLILICSNGTPGVNQYGANPKDMGNY